MNTSAALFAQNLIKEIADLVIDASKSLDPTPDRIIQVAPGSEVAWDANCDGQLWGRLVSLTPVDRQEPSPANPLDACRSPFLLATIELGIIRCAAVIPDNADAPPVYEITADGVQGISDMVALLSVLRCWPELRSVIGWTPQGPEGGYHGGYWTFTTRRNNCLDCEVPEEPEEPEVPEVPGG